jgi:hypothetical protein
MLHRFELDQPLGHDVCFWHGRNLCTGFIHGDDASYLDLLQSTAEDAFGIVAKEYVIKVIKLNLL